MTPGEPSSGPHREKVDLQEFQALFRQVCNWGRWGPLSPRGALNHLTPDRVAAAARLVRSVNPIAVL